MTQELLSVGIDIGTSPPRARRLRPGGPAHLNPSGGSEFHLREISAALQFYGLTPAPPCGAPVMEVPK